MGTSAKITFVETDGYFYKKELVSVRHHWDGYIDGVGHELAKWLLKKQLINGIGSDQYSNKYANGVGCLAAWYIAENKNQPGDFYVAANDYVGDYNYKVIVKETDLDDQSIPLNAITTIVVTLGWSSEKPIFIGTPEELLKFQEPEEEDEEDDG